MDTFVELVWTIFWFVLSAIILGCYLIFEAPLGFIIILVVTVIFWAINMLIIATKLDKKMNKEKNNG